MRQALFLALQMSLFMQRAVPISEGHLGTSNQKSLAWITTSVSVISLEFSHVGPGDRIQDCWKNFLNY